MSALDARDVDDVGPIEDGDVHRLVALGCDLGGHLLGLSSQVELLCEHASQLEEADTELVAQWLAGPQEEIAWMGEWAEQLVHGGARKPEPIDDLGRREHRGVEEQLEDVEGSARGGGGAGPESRLLSRRGTRERTGRT